MKVVERRPAIFLRIAPGELYGSRRYLPTPTIFGGLFQRDFGFVNGILKKRETGEAG
jgi:hypothetical protein